MRVSKLRNDKAMFNIVEGIKALVLTGMESCSPLQKLLHDNLVELDAKDGYAESFCQYAYPSRFRQDRAGKNILTYIRLDWKDNGYSISISPVICYDLTIFSQDLLSIAESETITYHIKLNNVVSLRR